MSIARFRLPDDCRAPHHPEGEVVLYADHAKALADARLVTEKQAEQARAWQALARERGAEIERLREALHRIGHGKPDRLDHSEDVRRLEKMASIARAALEEA